MRPWAYGAHSAHSATSNLDRWDDFHVENCPFLPLEKNSLRTDGRTYKRTNGRMDGQTNRRTDGRELPDIEIGGPIQK